eukprot:6805556-Pyramimonas_sp.AAC.1
MLRVSPKSVVICKDVRDAGWVARAARLAGYHITAPSQASFPGVDFSCGARLARATRARRGAKHKGMGLKIGTFAKAAKWYK